MHPDILVIGAGIFGLSVAHAAHRAGLGVRVLEAEAPGAGASGGVVGALAPHAPTRWRPMMAFQFGALAALPDHVAALEDRTGLDTGYRRTGRVAPIATERALVRARADIAAAPRVWGQAGRMDLIDAAAVGALAPGIAPFGLLRDDVSARIAPVAYLAALQAALPPGTVRPGRVIALDPGPVARTDADRHPAGAVVAAAGWQGWSLLPAGLRGRGVKGQAALLRAAPGDLPLVTHDGLYIVPHGDGTVAVGSTSEKQWSDPGPDALLDALLVRAATVVPALAGAPVLRRWAGIRPRPPGREPLAGPVPGLPGVWVAGGGFKIGFGIAHAVAEAIVAAILGRPAPIPLPDSFDPAANLVRTPDGPPG